MPKQLTARQPHDARQVRQVRQLARSVHAPADWILHAQMVARSWDGLRIRQIADKLACHPQTVQDHLHAFNERGVDGFGHEARLGPQAAPDRAEAQYDPRAGDVAATWQAHL